LDEPESRSWSDGPVAARESHGTSGKALGAAGEGPRSQAIAAKLITAARSRWEGNKVRAGAAAIKKTMFLVR